jgi:hypothetical protein
MIRRAAGGLYPRYKAMRARIDFATALLIVGCIILAMFAGIQFW